MNPTVANALLEGIAAVSVAVFFAFVRNENHQAIVEGTQNLELVALLVDPERYDSLDVSVTGYFVWHPDEPTLFASEDSWKELDFGESIQLEMNTDVDFQYADESPVVVSGAFFFDAEYGRGLQDYKGIFRVESIVRVAQ
jgi:hypothetical protein